ncbi:MBL fold metallo-hydrolase [Candidatus Shapirobacteria bacterium]|nr:MBL fold metallo-hydrolase [Candidatus Shapirobacteria bacterium]
MLKYEKLVLGDMNTNCYLVWDEETKEGVVIDPADAGVEIVDEIQRLGIKVLSIIATHGHFDHMLGALDIKLMLNIPLAVHGADLFLVQRLGETAEHFLKRKIKVPNIKRIDIDMTRARAIRLGEFRLKVMKTPGHTPGGLCFYSPEAEFIITGDMMFADGTVGETTHEYSSKKQMDASLQSILELPNRVRVLPGHGEEMAIGDWRLSHQSYDHYLP